MSTYSRDSAEMGETLLAAMPQDGSSLTNPRLIEKLGWDPNIYFLVRQPLVLEGRIRIGRGRGGTVSRVIAESASEAEEAGGDEPAAPDRPRESDLYPDFVAALEVWGGAQGWDNFAVVQTANQGSRRTGGTWTRPDFVVLGHRRFEYTPGIVRDLETFEVKPPDFGIEAVFETASHSRFATKSYLAAARSQEDDSELIERVETECQRFGLGLVFFDPFRGYEGWDFVVDPRRDEPDPADLERFIQDQIPEKLQRQMRMWLR